VFTDREVRTEQQRRVGWVDTHMISLATSRPVARWSVRLLSAVGAAGLVVFLTANAGGPGDPTSDAYRWLFVALFIVPALLCLARALLVAQQRVSWTLFGLGMLSWAAAEAVFFGHPNAPSPSLSDAFWMTSYCCSIAGVLTLTKSGFQRIHKGVWIDVALAGVATAAVAAALLVPTILHSTGGDPAAVITNLAYPLMDVLIVAVLFGVFTLSNGRPGRLWTMIAAIWLLQAVLDTFYLYAVASGEYVFGTLLDAGWPALALLLACASWHKPTVVVTRSMEESWGRLVVTGGLVTVGLALTTFDHWHRLHTVPLVLATLTLVAAFVRAAITFADLRTLASGKELAMRSALILDAAGEGIVGIDARATVTFVNPAAARMTGYAADELVGRTLHEALHHSRPDGTPYPIEECPIHASQLDGTIRESEQEVYWHKDGTSFAVEYTGTPIVDKGRILGAVVVLRDITARRQVERAKDEFTSVVSHELRTPLTSIRGSLGLIESGVLGPLPDKAERMIQIAVQNTDRLVRLINDILDLERLGAEGDDSRDSAACDAAELIAHATEAMLPTAVVAGVTLVVDTGPSALEGNADQIIQTLTNLIGNAVKFSPAGGTVRITSERRDEDILFAVSDAGPGIPSDKLEAIFGRFAQVDSSDSRQRGGTGLGLAISRTIVERHGGRIWAQSTPGAGSTFSFVLPVAPGAAQEYLRRPGGTLGSVLFCDDDDTILEVTGTALEECGYRVIVARSGEEAIECAISDPPDVVLLDLVLPGISGVETVLALAAHPATADIPIVVLSGHPRSESELGSGVVADWIEKPFASASLFDTLERAIGPRDDSFRVLVVERDPAVAEILSALLHRRGVASYVAAGGDAAVELCEQMRPDVILLNDELPDIDRLAMKDWLRVRGRLGVASFVGYDAHDVQDAERERREVGSIAQTLTRGRITPEEFQWRVMTLLARPRTQRLDSGARS
jgi:PAS domain S-box-containing protein